MTNVDGNLVKRAADSLYVTTSVFPKNTDVRVLHSHYNKALNLQQHENLDGGGKFWVKNPRYNKCLNLQSHEDKDNGRPNVWTCSHHNDQYWTYDGGRIRHAHYSSKYLNLQAHENRNSGTVLVWSCGGHEDQQWAILDPRRW